MIDGKRDNIRSFRSYKSVKKVISEMSGVPEFGWPLRSGPSNPILRIDFRLVHLGRLDPVGCH